MPHIKLHYVPRDPDLRRRVPFEDGGGALILIMLAAFGIFVGVMFFSKFYGG